MSLRDAGLVVSTRGARGGYELGAHPSEIRMSEVLRALEGPIAPMVCASEDAEDAPRLRPHRALHRQRAVGPRPRRDHGTLDAMTLADLVPASRHHPRRAARRDAGAVTPTPRRSNPPVSRSPFVTIADDRELVIRDLRVAPAANPDHEILQGIDLTIRKGEVHAIMGPNGSGKTTLAYALMGHPAYIVTGGQVLWKGRDVLTLSPDKRARLGLFLAFQYPTAIPGLSVASFLRTALNAKLQGIDKNRRHRPDGPDPRRHLDARLPRPDAREDGAAQAGRQLRGALRQRGLLGRREEAPRDAPDGRCSSRSSRSSTRPTPASTSTPCGSSPRASTPSSTRTWACC